MYGGVSSRHLGNCKYILKPKPEFSVRRNRCLRVSHAVCRATRLRLPRQEPSAAPKDSAAPQAAAGPPAGVPHRNPGARQVQPSLSSFPPRGAGCLCSGRSSPRSCPASSLLGGGNAAVKAGAAEDLGCGQTSE